MIRIVNNRSVVYKSSAIGIVFSLVLCILSLTTCTDSFQPDNTDISGDGFGSLTVSVGKSGVRTILPSIDMNISVYDIQGVGPNSASISQTGISESVITLDSLAVGSWTFTVTAYNAAGTAIGQGVSSVEITDGENSVTVTVRPLSGDGTFSYSVTWPSASLDVALQSVDVKAVLTPYGKDDVSVPCVRSSNSAAGSVVLAAGYYTLSFDIEEYGNLRYRMPVGSNSTVRIVKGETTTLSLSLSADDVYERATVSTPSVSIAAGTYTSAQTVTLSCATAGATIRYTTNGTLPGQTNGFTYDGTPVVLSCTTTLKAVAYKQGCINSSVMTSPYVITGTVASPVFALQPGIYYDPIEIVLTSATENAVIHYTTDGTEPGAYAGTIYTGSIPVTTSDGLVLIRAVACADLNGDDVIEVSSISSAQYVVTGYVEEPVFSIEAGTYDDAFNVTLSCATSNAQIYYTLDGTVPTPEYGTLYSGTPISIDKISTVKAIAVRQDWKESDAVTVSYILKTSAPAASAEGGTYYTNLSVTLSSATEGASIFYTIDGTDPTASSAVYSTPLSITAGKTVKAFSYKENWNNSDIQTWVYQLKCSSPEFTPSPRPILSGQTLSVTISAVTPDSVTMYTNNGTTPTASIGSYGSTVTVSPGMTLKALAQKSGWVISDVVSGVYPLGSSVTFNANGGSGTMAAQAIAQNSSASLSLNEFTRTEHTFIGWAEDDEAVTPTYLDAASFVMGTQDVTLYALWKITEYPITYELNGGTNNTGNPSLFTINSSTITLLEPTQTGYIFEGWFTDSSYTTEATQIEAGSTGSRTLYAKWTAVQYPISYLLDGGTNSAANPAQYTIADEITLQLPVKNGYTFDGWYADSSFTDTVTSIAAGTIGSKTLYAKWHITEYPVTYVLNGGTNNAGNPSLFTINSSTITFVNPVKAGYIFEGWYAESTYTTAVTHITTGSTGSRTLYAKWRQNGLNIGVGIQYPIDISFTWSRSPVLTGASVTVTAVTSRTVDQYMWYLDNTLITGQTGAACELAAGLTAGSHVIALIVRDGDAYSSESDTVNVIAGTFVSGISIESTSATIEIGNTQQLSATISPTNATNITVAWTSSNESVAAVNSTGRITGIAAGTATITAKTADGGYMASCEITVIITPVTSVSLNTKTGNILIGKTKQLSATVLPTNAYNNVVTWTSSNPSVASVSSTGLVTGLTAGTATITATTSDGGYTAMCTMTVTSPLVTMVNVEGGTFNNGTANMTVSSFYIGKYEVTQGQYGAVMGNVPGYCSSTYGLGNNYPVYYVTWYDCIAFCNALSVREGFDNVYTINGSIVTADYTKSGYRLPTESEWQFAARGGNSSNGYTYSGSNTISGVAWYSSNASSKSHTVGGLAANELGIYDMTGNVWEWCADWYETYPSSSQTNYTGPATGSYHVSRGGSWENASSFCTVSYRGGSTISNNVYSSGGFRVVRSAQ